MESDTENIDSKSSRYISTARLNECVQFLISRNISFLKHWPVHLLTHNPRACMFHYFNRGQVLVRDSNQSDWIYIVKSGSLSVLKKLKETQPQSRHDLVANDKTDTRRPLTDPQMPKRKKGKRKPYGSWSYQLQMKKRKGLQLEQNMRREALERLSSLIPARPVYKSQYEMDKMLDQTLPGVYNTSDRLGVLNYDSIIQQHKSRLVKKESTNTSDDRLPHIFRERYKAIHANGETPIDEKQEDETPVRLPMIRRTSKGAYMSVSRSSRRSTRKEENIQEEIERREQELRRQRAVQEEGRKTITEEFDNKPPEHIKLTEADIHPMFILVQVLQRGQYFGIHSTLTSEKQTSLSVVSNGAECIMISKKFFKDKSNDATLHHLQQTENRFPDDDELQQSLQDYVNWEADRKKIYLKVVNEKRQRKENRQQFLPQFSGQYSFRTGPT